MPMPTLMAKKYMTKKTARFAQEKKNRAAMAPTWNRPMKMEGDPVDASLLVLAAHAEILLDLLRDLGGDVVGGSGAGCGDVRAGHIGRYAKTFVLLCNFCNVNGWFRIQERRCHGVFVSSYAAEIQPNRMAGERL